MARAHPNPGNRSDGTGHLPTYLSLAIMDPRLLIRLSPRLARPKQKAIYLT